MSKFDIARLRKENGMSQGELASRLLMTQSFLSAIENGKSPLPIEKEEKLCEIFHLKNLDDYNISKKDETDEKKLNNMTDSDLFNQLLNRFHRQAHSMEGDSHHHDHHQQIEELQKKLDTLFLRNDHLMERNEKLSDENDRLRKQIDSYRVTIDSLREQIFLLKTKQE